MNFSKQISTFLNGVKDAFIQDQKDKGIRNTGRSARSIRKEVEPHSGSLIGVGYFHQQMHGRAPGKFPPIEQIEAWIRTKGITPRDPKTSIKSLAFLFARAIAKKGTRIFRGASPALDPSKLTTKLLADFSRDIGKQMKTTLIKDQTI